MEIRPADLPQLRDDIAASIRRPEYADMLRENIRVHGNRHPTHGHLTATQLAEAEAVMLDHAELFYVSEQMTDLARIASESLPDFDIQPEDVPSENGFVFFAGDLPRVYHGEPQLAYRVRGYAWVDLRGKGVLLHPFTDRDDSLDVQIQAGIADPEWREFNRQRMARVIPMADRATWWPYGATDASYGGLPGSESIQLSLNAVRAAWLLMAQPVSSTEDAVYDRASRRRFQRMNEEPPRVRVITLRRSSTSASNSESAREYHHQWIVRGHWRQQWYPARQVHRPVWIAPHIKGPEGAPLLGGEKVYALRR